MIYVYSHKQKHLLKLIKICQHVSKYWLEWWLEYHRKMPSTQYGFKKVFSTQENLVKLISSIRMGLPEDKIMIVTFLDIVEAYNYLILNLLYKDLICLGMPPFIVWNILKIFTNRKISLRLHDHNSKHFFTSLGLPQGDILSPLMYILYIEKLETVIP
ncbi:hypothetical protein HHI36_017415 [Cryptolaemus montrouzieri]|uniref:Reverse transcriptase domain-containing protein n=1 Tax=Cryptolaemus montrouzieri TaxID=559131 RepID=A0ABD2NMR4_9CUCU